MSKKRRPPDPTASRHAAARGRARIAKTGALVGGAALFGVAVPLARSTYAAHAKGKAKTLSAPAQFVQVVRENRLEAGIAAPASAPPDAVTSVS